MKNKIFIMTVAIIILLGAAAYITPPHHVYPRYGQRTATIMAVRFVVPTATQSYTRDTEDAPTQTSTPTPVQQYPLNHPPAATISGVDYGGCDQFDNVLVGEEWVAVPLCQPTVVETIVDLPTYP